jgi:hypothetical protein
MIRTSLRLGVFARTRGLILRGLILLLEFPSERLQAPLLLDRPEDLLKVVDEIGHHPTLDDPTMLIQRAHEPDPVRGFHERRQELDGRLGELIDPNDR